MEPQVQPLSPAPNQKVNLFGVAKKVLIAFLLVACGFALGTYGATLGESEQNKNLAQQGMGQEVTSDFLATYQYAGASSVAYDNGVALYLLDHAKGEPFCADHPRYTCKGTLYEVSDFKLKKVASSVLGTQLIHYEPGVRALLQSRWGDGGCRDTKFYLYDFATASSSLDFSASNCDEATFDAYQKSVSDYLAPFGL